MIKLLLWNIDLTPDISINFARNSKERYPKIAKVINEFDIVVLNECFLYRNELLNQAEHKYIYFDEKPWFKIFNSGVVILSKYPFENPQYYHYKNNSSWDIFISKGILKVSFDIKGKLFDLYGTHMQQYNNLSAQKSRSEQVMELIDFIKLTNSPSKDIILVGDLNMGPVYDLSKYPIYYENSKDAESRNRQYETLVNELELNDLVEEQEISHLLHRGSINIKRLQIPDYHLSDTGCFGIEF